MPILQWRESQMHVVRHDDYNVQVVNRIVTVSATIEHDFPGPIRQDAALFGAEGDEVRSVITLNVRQIAATEAHDSIVRRRDAG